MTREERENIIAQIDHYCEFHRCRRCPFVEGHEVKCVELTSKFATDAELEDALQKIKDFKNKPKTKIEEMIDRLDEFCARYNVCSQCPINDTLKENELDCTTEEEMELMAICQIINEVENANSEV